MTSPLCLDFKKMFNLNIMGKNVGNDNLNVHYLSICVIFPFEYLNVKKISNKKAIDRPME